MQHLQLLLSLFSLSLSIPPYTESALQLSYAAKEAGGNPKSVPAHEKVDEAARFMQQAVTDLTLTLEKAGGEAGLISGENNLCACKVEVGGEQLI